MSMTVDGVWAAGVWAPTVWGEGVWREGVAVETPAGGGTRVVPQHRPKPAPTEYRYPATFTKHARRWAASVRITLVVAEPLPEQPPELVYELETVPLYVQAPPIVRPGQVLAFKHHAVMTRATRKFAATFRVVHNDDAEALAVLSGMDLLTFHELKETMRKN